MTTTPPALPQSLPVEPGSLFDPVARIIAKLAAIRRVDPAEAERIAAKIYLAHMLTLAERMPVEPGGECQP